MSRRLKWFAIPLSAVVVATVAACGGGSGGTSGVLQAAQDRGTLRVALTGANPPWSLVDEKNQVVGYDADVAKEIAERIGIDKVEFVRSNFQNFIPGIQNNKFDIVISGQSITPERQKVVDFSKPYQVNGVVVFVAAGNTAIGGEDDLAGKRIAVTAGTTQEELARSIKGAEVKVYQNATLALTDVGNGRADAWLGSRFVGAYLADKNNLDVEAVGEFINLEVNAMTMRKRQKELRKAVDNALAEMIADGTLTEISKRWLGGLDMAAELKKDPESTGDHG